MTVYRRGKRYWMDTVIEGSGTACRWKQQTGSRRAVRRLHS